MKWISDLIGIGGHVVDYRKSRKLDQNKALIARFNRQLDLLNLALTRKHLDYDNRISRRLAAESLQDVVQAQRQVDFYNSEAGLYATQRGLAEWMTGSRIREIETLARAELGTSWAKLGVDRAAHAGASGVMTAQERRLAVSRVGQREVEQAELGVVGARRVSAQERYAAQRGTVGARFEALGAERVSIRRGGALRQTARIEQAAQEIGAGAASGAARGMRGSYRRTTAARAVVEAGRDLELFRMEDGLRLAQNAEQMAKAAAAGVDVERTYADEQARLGAEQARLIHGGLEARAGFRVTEAEQRRARDVHGAEAGLLGARERAWHGRYGLMGEHVERERRKGAVEVAGFSLREAGSRLQAGAAERTKAKAGIQAQKQTYEVWLGDTARKINQWQLEQLPKLPDYEGQGTRSALSSLLNIASEIID